MKKTILMIAVLTLLSLFAFPQDKDYYSGSFVRLTYVKGDVVVQKAGGLGSEAGVANLVIVEGDQVETKGGRAEISFGRKNYLRVDNGTLVEFSNLPREGDDRVRIHLLSGNVYLRIGRLEVEKSFEVHTPDASFYVLEEGLFRFDARGGGETVLSVLEGSVEAAGEAGSQLIGSRETLVAANGQLGSQGNLSYSKDEFDYWNEDRDALQSQYVSKRYLPSELEDYESELADNGYWTYERPYGNVWVPYVHSYADWRPYYYGYWDWYPLCGWTWIPYETWGWSVYHYGRWGWRFGLGWYWIPHYAWGPAWVHWYWGYDYCGWSPLSWYNYPCVIRNNYFYDRYHGNYYPGDSHALTVIHRDQLRNRNIHDVALSRSEASRLENITMQAQQPDVQPGMLKHDLRNADTSNAASTLPRVGPSALGRGEGGQAAESSSRFKSSSPGQGQVVSRDQPSAQGSRVTSDKLSQSQDRSVSSFRSSSSAERQTAGSLRSKSESAGSVSSSPRRIRSYDSGSNRTSAPSPPTIRSYSSSSRVSSSDGARSTARSSSSRVYSPSSSITRYGSSSGSSSSRTQERRTSVSGGDRSISSYPSSSRSSYSAPRSSSSSRSYTTYPSRSDSSSSYSSRSRSYSGSSSRSVFSAPRSSSSSRSYNYSSPSRSGSSSSYSSRSRSYSGSSSRSVFSAPRSSSSSRSYSYSSPSRSRSSSSYSSGSRSSSSSRSHSSSSRSSSSSSRSHSGSSARRKG